MRTTVNEAAPTVMHVDENSAFATIEQQAHVLLRGKPIAVAAYTGDSGCVVSPSREAKVLGVKVGMTVGETKALVPQIVILPPNPPRYRHVHELLCSIFREYSPDVTPLSIDEAVINLSGTPALREKGTDLIAREIKQKIRERVGVCMTCSVGVGTNRFLSKTAAGLLKPDGYNVIDHRNLRQVYARLALTDLCGIASRNAARLMSVGITSPLEFLDADLGRLNLAFESINGYYWSERLRGFEIDGVDHARGSYGNSYSLKHPTAELKPLSEILMKLTEKAGERMRRGGYSARGLHVALQYGRSGGWHAGRKFDVPQYANLELYHKALYLLNQHPKSAVVTNMAGAGYDLVHEEGVQQLSLFNDERVRLRRLTDAMDKINDTWGQYTVFSALILGLNHGDEIIDRISFGGVEETVRDVYERAPSLLLQPVPDKSHQYQTKTNL